MLTILLIVLALAFVLGGFGQGRFGYVSWSPAALLVVVLLFMYFSGNRFG